MEHERFHYTDLKDLQQKTAELSLQLPLSRDTKVLFEKVPCGTVTFENRFVIQPMEGCDSETEGNPGELTRRRYLRFAESGAALIWMEAVAILPEARANPRQLFLQEKNLDDFARLISEMKERSFKRNGYEPKIVIQATHSGRYAKPNGTPEPIIAYNNPLFEKNDPISMDRIVTDDELMRIEECYAGVARLAKKAGFDGIDVKCCHRYLASELLSAYERPGIYGGSFENRTRFLRNCIRNAQQAQDETFFVTSRLNTYDGFSYPYGFGVDRSGSKWSWQADEAYVSRVIEDTQTVCDMAQERGIKVAFEYHGWTLTDNRFSAVDIRSRINRPNMFLYWQPNFGLSETDNQLALSMVLPHMEYAHVFYWDPNEKRFPLSEGESLWRKWIAQIQADEKPHCLLLEFVKDNSPEQFKEDAKTLKSLIASAGKK